MFKKLFFQIPFMWFPLVLLSCNPETLVDEKLLEDSRDPLTLVSFSLSDASSGARGYSNSQVVNVQVQNDTKAMGWCLSETQTSSPTPETCSGGQGASGGWSLSKPSTFTLTSGDSLKTVFLWLLKSDGSVHSNGHQYQMTLDTIAPVVSLNSLGNINSSNKSNFALDGTCEIGPDVLIRVGSLDFKTPCESGSWARSVDVSAISDGAVTISIYQTDLAGNTSVAATQLINKDTLAPSISLTNPTESSFINNLNKANFNFIGTCSEDGVINISGDINTSTSCSGGTFNQSLDLSGLVDGSLTFNLDLNDVNGNPANRVSITLLKDTVSPTVSFTSPANGTYINNSSASAFTISGNCSESGKLVNFGGALSGSTLCSGSFTFSKTFDFSGISDGNQTLTIDHDDSAGNSASQGSRTFIKDVVAPNISQTTYSNGSYSKTNTVTFGGACLNGDNISISGTDTSSTTCSGSSWSYTSGVQSVDGNYSYTFTQTDSAGNSTSVSASWSRDATAPVVQSININSGATTTNNNNVVITFTSTDTRSDIESFCIKYNTTVKPSDADSCWKTLSSIGESITSNFTLTDYPFQLGVVAGNYDVRIWIKDNVGNISTVSNSQNGISGTDLYSISYVADPPPIFEKLIATSSDAPNSPLTSGDTTVTIGNDLYVKWKVTDDNAIPSGNVDLYYTTDNVNYTLLASSINDGINGSCTLTGDYTGCFHQAAASPTSSYYKIKLVVKDSGVSTVFSESNALNTGSINFLTGNTSLGIGGSATSAILIGEGEDNFNDASDPQAIAVTKDGHIFYKYKNKGVLFISPQDGLLKYLLKDNNITAGDGGSVFSATAHSVKRILLDYDENLIIYDNDQIRKVDFSTDPWSITTIAGGGGNTPENEVATQANLPTINGSLVPTPNGRLYFPSGKDLWFYDPTDNLLKKYLSLSGFGTGDNTGDLSSYDISSCNLDDIALSFDKSTSQINKIIGQTYLNTNPICGNRSVGGYRGNNSQFNLNTGIAETPHPPITMWSSTKFTGLDGKLYVLHHGRYELQVYNPTLNSWERILGNGNNGRCSDGTSALNCPTYIMSAFVNEFGKIYFVDMGVIRYIDESGNVQSLAGQPRNFGVGKTPLVGRYSQINFFEISGNDLYIKNKLENQIVKFNLSGGNLSLVAGNSIKENPSAGDTATDVGLPNCGWAMPCGFKIDPVNNRLYHHVISDSSNTWYIDLTTGQWVNQGGYFIDSGGRPSFLGYDGSNFLVYAPSHKGGSGNLVQLMEFSPDTNTKTAIYGRTDILTPLTSDFTAGAIGTDSTLGHTQGDYVQMTYVYDSASTNWLVGYKGKNGVFSLPSGGGTVNTFETLANNMHSFDFRIDGGNEYIYYCATDGKLYKRDVLGDTETELSFPISTMTCAGNTVKYHSPTDSLIFIYQENGLYGIAEFKNP